ncbi:MAG: hypothetical protein U0176_23015 [Bacteroidia bacterium]
MQSTNSIMMVRPAAFGFDPETAANNSFQNNPGETAADDLQLKAQYEFDQVAASMRANGVNFRGGEGRGGPGAAGCHLPEQLDLDPRGRDGHPVPHDGSEPSL